MNQPRQPTSLYIIHSVNKRVLTNGYLLGVQTTPSLLFRSSEFGWGQNVKCSGNTFQKGSREEGASNSPPPGLSDSLQSS